MIADVLTSIKAYLYDRTSSPLLGAFATSLALWNFKILMLFFSKTPYAVKVWEIDFFYSQPFFSSIDNLSWLTNYWMCLYLMPAVTSLFYIYVFPWFSHRVFEFSYNKQIALNNKKKEMQGSELISAEEKEELLSKIEKLNIENRANVLKLREDITQLESQRDTVIKEREDFKAKSDDLRVELDKLNDKYTSLLAESDDTKRPNPQSTPATELDHILSSVSVQDKNLKDLAREQIAAEGVDVGSNDSSVDSKNFKRNENDALKQEDNRPSYLRFYQSLTADKKYITEEILGVLLDTEASLDNIHFDVKYESILGDDKSNLKRHLSQMKLYGIVNINDYGVGTVYGLTANGEELYKYILENQAPLAS
ncbi:TPA: hypothetical protein NKA25_003994 [Vibrio parahaemolyticus]|nr:hypothetical protein [Vibrio parahaemolyticus]